MTRINRSFGPAPWHQGSWDGRAAGNFIGGGVGAGLIAVAVVGAGAHPGLLVAGMVLVLLGLVSVWFEIGRPWRALHVYFHPRRSWMSREAWVGPLLLAAAGLAALGVAAAEGPAALLALAYLVCQGRILQAAKGIPAWRQPLIVPLIMATGLCEGAGLVTLLAALGGGVGRTGWLALGALVLLRFVLGAVWYRRLAPGLTAQPRAAVNSAGHAFNGSSLVVLALVLGVAASPLGGAWVAPLQALAGLLALAGGVVFKWLLITRAAYNQGFALPHLPVRGVRRRVAQPGPRS